MADQTLPDDQSKAESTPAHEFPHKLRVHALARILGLSSREVLAHLSELGTAVRSPQSSIDRSAAVAVRDRITALAEGGDTAAESDAAQPAAEAPPEIPAVETQAADTPVASSVAEAPTTHAQASLFSAIENNEPTAAAAAADHNAPLFLPPAEATAAPKTAKPPKATDKPQVESDEAAGDAVSKPNTADEAAASEDSDSDTDGEGGQGANRRRRRGRRGRGRGRGDAGEDSTDSTDENDVDQGDAGESSDDDAKTADQDGSDSADADADGDSADDGDTPTRRRRRRRRRKGGGDGDDAGSPDDPPNTVVHEREPRNKPRARDQVQGISGSTRLEAKRQRRRDGRDTGRRRPPILTESEFLARRESVDRVMVIRERTGVPVDLPQHGETDETPASTKTRDYTQVAVLEDGVLVEHFVTTSGAQSMVGNIYLGKVQNVLPGMEAAFVDIGRGRNGVLYAGEVNWDAAGLDGGSRKIEQALKPGDQVVVQVSKDPVGHKGARLTTQVSLAGRFLVYVPGGSSTGISRKLPDTERKRLKQILSGIVPDDAGVIIRTASEGVSAEELARDVERLQQQWEQISKVTATAGKAGDTSKSPAPQTLYEEPDLLVKVVRDLFNEDFGKLIIEGDGAWDMVHGYVESVAPDLLERVERFEKPHADSPDSFVVHRIDEQLTKALDRKVWLPSGGTLIIEHTEAMTVIDVNTGKFTGSGGNLEETVTRNNLEAAEEIVRQMRLRDIGGMIIVDFIDMVLESNRDLVLRRLTEALGRDRTRHQVSEVTSLGLVQMTRKRLGTGLLEAFSTTCTCCQGRGILVHANPVEAGSGDDSARGEGSRRSRRGRRGKAETADTAPSTAKPSHNPAEHPMFRAMAAHHDEDGVAVEGDGAAVPVDGSAPQVESDAADQSEDKPKKKSGKAKKGRAKSKDKAGDEDRADKAADDRAAVDKARDDKTAGDDKQESGAKTETSDKRTKADASIDASAAEAPEAPVATKPPRRRAVRRPAAAPSVTAPAEPIVDAEPVTTGGSAAAVAAQPAATVRRRARRSVGRAAGPPAAEGGE
ncbi:translation initiation factor IF-2 N-terminal domain-containing protein [Jongsikchunia kroppenstedtii]|uniref:translation initiation factor IF-2 N-terminal domain-containing protein n=1 Tax=Jongsikchunia kroppenstedtii TaxID=1121721 RepID=UPI00035CB3E2|nr:translation initiation factor IF-2 N-terminal domain-containing protein [Jongsikchunia kroppenstedtii]